MYTVNNVKNGVCWRTTTTQEHKRTNDAMRANFSDTTQSDEN